MTTATISDMRKNLSETLNTVQYNHERVIVQRQGKDVAVIISIEDYKLLEELEDKQDIESADRVLANIGNEDFLSLSDSLKKLGL